jgi:hypothetical protein
VPAHIIVNSQFDPSASQPVLGVAQKNKSEKLEGGGNTAMKKKKAAAADRTEEGYEKQAGCGLCAASPLYGLTRACPVRNGEDLPVDEQWHEVKMAGGKRRPATTTPPTLAAAAEAVAVAVIATATAIPAVLSRATTRA